MIRNDFYNHILKIKDSDECHGTCPKVSPQYKEVVLKAMMKDHILSEKIKEKLLKAPKYNNYFHKVK